MVNRVLRFYWFLDSRDLWVPPSCRQIDNVEYASITSVVVLQAAVIVITGCIAMHIDDAS